MDKTAILIIAGIFAVSNMGHAKPSVEKVASVIKYPPADANASACMFAEQYMETNEHEKIFTDEVKMWVRYLSKSKKELEQWKKSSPDIFKLYDDAAVQVAAEGKPFRVPLRNF